MSLFADLRYAARTLSKSPVFCSVAILSLALGIGANAGIFTLLDQVMLHLLPVEEPNKLAQLVERGDWYGSNNGMNVLSYPMYEDLRKQNQVFSGMLCVYVTAFSVSFEGRNERVAGELVSGTYFPVLGVRPALGRLFTAEEDRTPTLKVPIYAGRDFTDRDAVGRALVTIVNEKFAQHYFGGHGAVGRHIGMGGDPGTKTDIEIIGVVRDTKASRMNEEWQRQIFFPYLQNDWAAQMTGYVRTSLPSEQMFPAIRAAVGRLDANLPVYQMKTEEKQRNDSLAVERMSATLSSSFGVLATVLAAIGIYGVMAFLVARRTREIGIRMAMGASARGVVWLVMREVLTLAGAGVLIGLPVALAVTRLLESQLYGIAPHDPVIAIGATLGILGVAALSGYLPARRATRVDPVTALRYE